MKKCYACGIEKPENEFRNGRNQCRFCSKKYNRAWVIANSEKTKKSQEQYREKNKEKNREYQKDYYLKNIDKYKENGKTNYIKNKEAYIQRAKEWAIKNVEKYKNIIKAATIKHKEKRKECSKKWAQENKERKRMSINNWRKNNPEKVSIQKANRHILERGGKGNVTYTEWVSLLERYGNKCLCCNKTNIKLTQDHIVPLSKGGEHHISNIQPLCGPCNSSKGTKTIDYRS